VEKRSIFVLPISTDMTHTITIGQTINHHRFGMGTITAVNEANAEISFADAAVGVKFIMLSYVKQVLGIVEEKPAKKDWSKYNAAQKAKVEKFNAAQAEYEKTRTEEQRIADELWAWGASRYKDGSLMTEREGLLYEVKHLGGFAAEVATTCLKYGKVSSKQAAIMAKAYCNR
jgi:hypothetical protein